MTLNIIGLSVAVVTSALIINAGLTAIRDAIRELKHALEGNRDPR